MPHCPNCGEILIVTDWPGFLGMEIECPIGDFREVRDWSHDVDTVDRINAKFNRPV